MRTYINLVLNKSGLVLACVLPLLLTAGWFARDFQLDASSDSLVREGDSDLAFSREINDRYGTQDFIFVVYTPSSDLFTPESLAQLRSLSNELQALDRVDSVDSILSVPLFEVVDMGLTDLNVDNLLTIESPGIDITAARDELINNQAYQDVLISADGETAALVVYFSRNTELNELLERRNTLQGQDDLVEIPASQSAQFREITREYDRLTRVAQTNLNQDISRIREILDRYRGNADIVMGGVPMIADDLITFVKSDLINFGTAIVLFIILSLSYLFRKVRYVVLPLLCSMVVAVTVIGLLGLLDWRVTVISSNFISLLLIITISLTVHLMVRYRELEQAEPDTAHIPRLRQTLQSMLIPCAYTSLTTVVAFGSLVVSDIPPIINFGWMMVVGIILAFGLTFTIFPALLSRLPASPSVKSPAGAFQLSPKLAVLTDRHGKAVLGCSVLLLVFAVMGMNRLRVENSFINYFDESTEIYQGMVQIDREMGGTTPLDVVIDLNRPNPFDEVVWEGDDAFTDEDDFFGDEAVDEETEAAYWFTSDKMQEIIEIHDYLDALPETGKVLSLATMLKLAYRLNNDESLSSLELAVLYNRIPDNYKESLIRPYVSVPDDQIRFSIRVRESDPNLVRGELLSEIRQGLQDDFGFAPEQIHLTGMLVLYNNMLQSLFDSQILTLALVLAVIMLMFVVLFRSLKLALIGIVPNILAAGTVLGIMGWFNIPLDMMTITIAAISVGIGVDNTIHYIHRFKSRFAEHGNDYRQTMHYCHNSIGYAMYYTGFTIVAGFSILVLSNFIPTIYFGLLTSLAMILALLGALTLLPQLLIIFKPLGKESDA